MDRYCDENDDEEEDDDNDRAFNGDAGDWDIEEIEEELDDRDGDNPDSILIFSRRSPPPPPPPLPATRENSVDLLDDETEGEGREGIEGIDDDDDDCDGDDIELELGFGTIVLRLWASLRVG